MRSNVIAKVGRKVASLTSRLKGGPVAAPYTRHQYKSVWTSLSGTEGEAKYWVQGSESEEQLLVSARNDLERLRRAVGISPTDEILEIGCGVGRLGKVLAPICRVWTGCDVSPHMLQYAARRLRGLPNVRFVELSGYDLKPVASASQDLVYCTVVFMHLTEWDRYNYVEEAHRVLRPGGRLYIDNISLTSGYGWGFFQQSRGIDPAARPPQIGSTSTPQEFEVYLSRAGFASQRVDIVDDAWVVGVGMK
jgi:SAM-dependent methyltransferase